MKEDAWFRLALVVALVAAAIFGYRFWTYRSYASADWQEMTAWSSEYRRYLAKCEPAPKSYDYSCALAVQDMARADTASREFGKDEVVKDDASDMAIGIPIACFLAFFLLRWALTGRLRPLWPLRRRAVTASP